MADVIHFDGSLSSLPKVQMQYRPRILVWEIPLVPIAYEFYIRRSNTVPDQNRTDVPAATRLNIQWLY